MADIYYCEKCNKTMNEADFYRTNDLEKYPNGKLNQCKKCITMHIDNWDPDTYLWILKECDVPYVPDEWNKLMMKYQADGKKITSLSILGRYLSKMQLKQYRDFRWKDTEFLRQAANNKIEQTMKNQGFTAQQIADAVQKATFTLPEKIEEPDYDALEAKKAQNLASGSEDYFAEQADAAAELGDDDLDLTPEDCIMLRLKWGKGYKKEEWVYLEKLYNDMMQSYDIQTAGHIDTLKLICKTSLKANQLIDIGDVEGFQKMSKTYDTLMKSGRFTAAQNKEQNGDFIDSIGELVAICETEGFIPRYYISQPNDKVDETIMDMQRYTRSLVESETNLSQLLEEALIKIQKEDAAAEEDDAEDTDDIFEDIDPVSSVEHEIEDLEEYNLFLDDDSFLYDGEEE